MKVLLINEPFVKDFNRSQRWAARTRGRVLRAPDWLAYATAVLEASGIAAHLFDFPAHDLDKEDLRQLIRKEQPDHVVLDSTTPSIFSDIECARICKDESDATVLMVGPHCSALPEETLLLSEGAVDVVCIGEYDLTVKEVISHYPHLTEVDGICYLKDGRPHTTRPRRLIQDLDSLPFPAWHQLDLMRYFDGTKLHPYIDIFSGRGCPHTCIFCLWPEVMHGHQIRLRAPEKVVDEIEHDIGLCPQVVQGGEFFFEDDTFTINKANAMAICEEILRRKLQITFSVNARTDTADRELFTLLKKAGCRELLVGFESGSDSMLATMQKRESVANAHDFMALAKASGLDVHGCFVLGLPGETKESIDSTLAFACDLGLHTVQFSAAVPFPGTEFFRICKENNLLLADSWDQWLDGGEQSSVISYPGLSSQYIHESTDRGLKQFYFRPSYMVKFLLSTRSKTDLYRKIRGAKNFISYLISDKKTK